MDMLILLLHCFVISCYVFFPNAAELNKDFQTDAIFTLMKRIDAMERKIEDMERLANEASEREKMMLGRIEYLEKMRSQSEILTNELLTRQEVMQRKISELHNENHNQQEETTVLEIALSNASAYDKINHTGPHGEEVATTKLLLRGISVRDISEKPKPSFVHRKRFNGGSVAFSTFLSHYEYHLGLHQVIKYDGVLTNEGNGYNPYTGIFTCPEDGLYLISFFTATVNEHKAWVELVVDGVPVSHAVSEGIRGGHDDQGGNVAILRIRAGQSVWTAMNRAVDTELDSLNGYRHVSFSGVRLSS